MKHFFKQSISRLVMASFVFVLLLPLGFIISYLNYHSWETAEEELQEKHLLIATGLESPIQQYVENYKQSLNVFLNTTNFVNKHESQLRPFIHSFANSLDNLSSASYLSATTGRTIISVNDKYKVRGSENLRPFEYHIKEYKYKKYVKNSSTSDVIRSRVSLKPVVVMTHHVLDAKNNKRGTIFLELELKPISDMCRMVRFGKKGHCEIFDKTGQVIAHQRHELEDQIADLSDIGILNKMREAKSGTWSFRSPTLDEDMIAGYHTVENLGWGIFILQPESELKSPFKELINTVLTWLIVGIIIALLVAYILTHQITKPLNSLLIKSKEIGIRPDTFNLGAIPKNSPSEVRDLWTALSALVDRLHESNREVSSLNYSLSKDIEKATAKLRASNLHLYKMSSLDYLTKIANRRYFEDSVNKILENKPDEQIGIIVIDVDKFKHINDHYAHEAGDLALKHIAKIMNNGTRGKDIPARLGGDEFVAYIHNCKDSVLVKVAENIRKKVQNNPIEWEGNIIELSLSVGTVSCHAQQDYSLDQLLKFADEAMYESKEAGRNNVSSYNFKSVDPNQKNMNKTEELEHQITENKKRALEKRAALLKETELKEILKEENDIETLNIELLVEEEEPVHSS